jgi:hypothetical protein
VTRQETEKVRKLLKGALAAFDEIAAEFVSKKRAANWAIVNDGLRAVQKFLCETERRKC